MTQNDITLIFNLYVLRRDRSYYYYVFYNIDIATETILTKSTLICTQWMCKTHQIEDLALQNKIDSGSLWQLSAVILYHKCMH